MHYSITTTPDDIDYCRGPIRGIAYLGFGLPWSAPLRDFDYARRRRLSDHGWGCYNRFVPQPASPGPAMGAEDVPNRPSSAITVSARTLASLISAAHPANRERSLRWRMPNPDHPRQWRGHSPAGSHAQVEVRTEIRWRHLGRGPPSSAQAAHQRVKCALVQPTSRQNTFQESNVTGARIAAAITRARQDHAHRRP